MKKQSLWLFYLLSSIPCVLQAEESRPEVGERPYLPPKEAIEELILEQLGDALENEPQDEIRSGVFFDQTAPKLFSSSYHGFQGVSSWGDQVEFEDGSVWKVRSADASQVLTWHREDLLVLLQNTSWFSRYHYKIWNKSKDQFVEVNLHQGPLKSSPYTRRVSSIDFSSQTTVLNDLSRWQVFDADRGAFSEWQSGDYIILGSNASGDSKYEALLVNVTMNHFVRARQF